MPRRVALDPSLAALPFSVAEAHASGLGRGRLASDDLARPFHGVRALGEHSPEQLYAPRMRPGDRFSHTSAAELWGAPLPSRLMREAVHVTATGGRTRPRAAGVVGHESTQSAWVSRGGLPASDPATMFVELGRMLSVPELVAVGDYLVLDPRVLDPLDLRPYATVDALRAAIEREPARGVSAARRALALTRGGVESPKETELRLLALSAGFPEPTCGYLLLSPRGHEIGWFDLAWPEWHVIAEYDGDQHRRSTRQYNRDISRFDAAAEADWHVVRVRSSGLAGQRQETVARLARALKRGGWVPNRRESS